MASIVVIFGGQEQSTHALDKPKHVVGREPDCEICIDNLGISRKHCAFSVRGEAFVVEDLGSANGTFVNGKKVVEHYLNNGDEVVIGKYTLRFVNESQQKEAPQKDAGVPDTLNTYVMDGAKIQEQLAKMRAQQGIGAGAAPGATKGSGVAAAPAATAKDYAKAMDVPAAPEAGQMSTMKTLLIVAFGAIFVLIVAVVVILVMFFKKPS